MASKSRYIPSGNTIESVIQSLNDFLGTELCLPGQWSPRIFFEDLKTDPVRDKKELAELVLLACQNNMSYLEFYKKSRGHEKKCSSLQKRLWAIFSQGSIMLYFEPLFLRLLDEFRNKEDEKEINQETIILLLYMDALSKTPISQWNSIVAKIGACCFQFFAKEPENYVRLLFCHQSDKPECMTDQELLEGLGETSLTLTAYRGKISINDSRTILIQKYRDRFNQQ